MTRALTQVLCITALLLSSGCAGLINQTGRYRALLRESTPRAQVRATLGNPISSNADTDVFNVRGKIYDESRAEVNMMCSGVSFGIWEAFVLPPTLLRLPFECFSRHNLIIQYYDFTGTQVVGRSVVDLFESPEGSQQPLSPGREKGKSVPTAEDVLPGSRIRLRPRSQGHSLPGSDLEARI